jgi:hypothetical protein
VVTVGVGMSVEICEGQLSVPQQAPPLPRCLARQAQAGVEAVSA